MEVGLTVAQCALCPPARVSAAVLSLHAIQLNSRCSESQQAWQVCPAGVSSREQTKRREFPMKHLLAFKTMKLNSESYLDPNIIPRASIQAICCRFWIEKGGDNHLDAKLERTGNLPGIAI